jgi:transcriptional regulator with XRE-family HTH domain
MSRNGDLKPNLPRKIGRPPIVLPDLDKVEELAAKGLTQEQIAKVLGMHWSTLIEKKRAFPKFSEAIERGKARGTHAMANALYDAGMNGNVSAMTFYLDRRGGWKQTVELTGKDGGPITLAAMREAFAAEIEGTAKPVSKKKAKQITDESDSD